MISTKGKIIPLWQSTVHKDSICFLSVINMEKKYACTLCIDGYFKLI